MKANTMKSTEGYVAPEVEIVSAMVERGFDASYGDHGEAGDDFDIFDNGEF